MIIDCDASAGEDTVNEDLENSCISHDDPLPLNLS